MLATKHTWCFKYCPPSFREAKTLNNAHKSGHNSLSLHVLQMYPSGGRTRVGREDPPRQAVRGFCIISFCPSETSSQIRKPWFSHRPLHRRWEASLLVFVFSSSPSSLSSSASDICSASSGEWEFSVSLSVLICCFSALYSFFFSPQFGRDFVPRVCDRLVLDSRILVLDYEM